MDPLGETQYAHQDQLEPRVWNDFKAMKFLVMKAWMKVFTTQTRYSLQYTI